MTENAALIWEYILLIGFTILTAFEIKLIVYNKSEDKTMPLGLLLFFIFLLFLSTSVVGITLSAIFHIPSQNIIYVILFLCLFSVVLPIILPAIISLIVQISSSSNKGTFFDKLKNLPKILNMTKEWISEFKLQFSVWVIGILSFITIALIIYYVYNVLNINIPEWILMFASIFFPAIPIFIYLYFATNGFKE